MRYFTCESKGVSNLAGCRVQHPAAPGPSRPGVQAFTGSYPYIQNVLPWWQRAGGVGRECAWRVVRPVEIRRRPAVLRHGCVQEAAGAVGLGAAGGVAEHEEGR